MAHMTNKKRKERDKNALNRGFNGFNTGTVTWVMNPIMHGKQQHI